MVLDSVVNHLINYRLGDELPSQQELARLKSNIQVIGPVRDLLCQCIQGLSSLTIQPCRIEREKNIMELLDRFLSLVRDGNHPDFERILQRIQMMKNSVGDYISQSQEATRDAFRRLLPCLDAYIRGNDDFDLVAYLTFLHNLLSDCALVHQPIVRKLLGFCTNMPPLGYSVCRLEEVDTFLAEILEVMCDNDDPIVVEFLQCLKAFHCDLQQSLESKRQDFIAFIVEYTHILKNYAKSGKVDEQTLLNFTCYDSNQDSYKAANPLFVISITGAPAHAPQDVSEGERVKFVREAIRQAFEMTKKISDFAPHPVPGGEHSYFMPHPVPDALKPLSELRFSLL
jgi:hypothetical protein